MIRVGMTVVALAMIPTILAAQTDSSRMRGVDTSHARARRHQTAAGEVGRVSRNYGLTQDQVTQLQTALKQDDCNPGPIDGIIGPRTRRAMNCARQKSGVTGNNPNDLFRSLNLTFTTPDSLSGGRGMSRIRGDTSMHRPTRPDTMRRRPSTKKDTTPGS